MKSRADLVLGSVRRSAVPLSGGRNMYRVHRIRVLALACMSAIAPAFAAEQYRLDIESQPLSSALQEFAEQSGLQIVYYTEVAEGQQAKAVAGTLTAEEALRRLLANTDDLQFETLDEHTIAIREKHSNSSTSKKNHSLSGTEAMYAAGLESAQNSQAQMAQSGTNSTQASSRGTRSGSTEVAEMEPVVVTGSRLKRTEIEGPQPVNVYTQEDIARSGRTSIGEYLNTLPEVDSSFASEAGGFALSDLSTVQLRGLPAGTTLVLINGRNPGVSPVQEGIAFNLNNVPAAAVERIEIVPQGSSAIYGSNALAGVINIILKDNLQGLSLDARYGQASDWHDESISLAWGKTWSRGSISLIASYLDQSRLRSDRRAISADYDRRGFGGSDRRTTLCNQGNIYSVDGQNLPGLQSPQAGVPGSGMGRPDINDFLLTQGQVNRCTNSQDLIVPREQMSVMLNGSVEIASNLNLKLEALYSTYDQSHYLGPRTFSRILVPASNAYNPFGTDVLVDYAFTDATTGNSRTYDFQRYLIGLEGAINSWEWGAGVWFTSDDTSTKNISGTTSWNTSAIDAALASPDPGSALNLFSPGSAASSGVVDGLFFANSNIRESRTMGMDVVVKGPLVALAAGSLDVAFGAEYQEYSIGQHYHNPDMADNAFEFESHRYALFAEGRLPLLAGFGSAQSPRVVLSAAVRRDKYADAGAKTTPSVGLEWRPSRTLLVRGSYAEAFKAPGITSLEREQFQGDTEIFDPRRGGELVVVNTISGGNPDLEPESGDATSIGMVWDSDVIPGLQAELTWWKISITDQIVAEPNRQLIVDNEAIFPGRVQRGAAENGGPGPIISVDRTALNMSQIDASGFDFDLRHRFVTRFGDFMPRLRVTRTQNYDVRLVETSPTEDRLNIYQFGPWAHKWRGSVALAWNYGNYSSTVSGRYIDKYRESVAKPDGSFWELGNYWLVDANLRYEFAKFQSRQMPSRAYLSLGVNNLLNREPQYSNLHPLGYDGTSFDIRGRTLYAAFGLQW